MRFSSILIHISLFVLLCFSCNNDVRKNLQQGEIHLKIEYDANKGFHKEIMPNNMTISFKNNKVLFDMTSTIGNSGIIYLSNPNKEIHDMYCRLLSLKYSYQAPPNEILPGFELMSDPIFDEKDDTKKICGYTCNCVEVTFSNNGKKKYKIWYTKDINIKDPNKATPYEPIDGVLMDFVFLFENVEMHFTAENVYDMKIDDDIFERRTDFIKTDKSNIIEFIYKMLSF